MGFPGNSLHKWVRLTLYVTHSLDEVNSCIAIAVIFIVLGVSLSKDLGFIDFNGIFFYWIVILSVAQNIHFNWNLASALTKKHLNTLF